tara:strand:- start:511 stop:1389 length:879 start_codon:yes stop_codon:yes gene_type:complete
MPIEKVNGGYKWGKSGKVYPTKAQAAKQARAAYASGYKGYQSGGTVTQDTFAKDFAKSMLKARIMSDPRLRQKVMMAKRFKDQGLTGLGKGLGQRAGIQSLFKKVGPWGMLLQNKGGPLGLGIMNSGAPMSSKIMRGLLDPRVAGRLKFAQAFPQIAGLGWLMNKIQPRIEGQRGALGQGLGPQMANLANRMSSGKIRTHDEAMKDFGPGIMGGTLGPRIKNAFGGGGSGGGTGIFGGTLGPRIRNAFGGSGSGGGTGLFGGTLGPRIASWFGFGDSAQSDLEDTTISSKKK